MLVEPRPLPPSLKRVDNADVQRTNIPMEVFRTALANREKPAMGIKRVNAFRWYSFGEVLRATMGFSQFLRDRGIAPGDRVAILSKNRPEWVISDLGILAAGGVSVPFYDTLSSKSVQFLLRDCGAKGIVLSNDQQLKKVLPHLDSLPDLEFIVSLDKILTQGADDVRLFSQAVQEGVGNTTEEAFLDSLQAVDLDTEATIIYTSGTTSLPKGARLTHRNILFNVRSCDWLLRTDDDEIALSYLPLAHVMERMSHYFYLIRGLSVVHSRGQDRLMDELQEVRPHVLVCVPRFFEKVHSRIVKQVETFLPPVRFLLNRSIEHRQDPPIFDGFRNDGILRVVLGRVVATLGEEFLLKRIRKIFGGRLRFFISGGAPLDKEVGEFFEGIGIPILEGYGLTETAPIISLNTEEEHRYGTVGKPLPGVEVRIDASGEIQVLGPNVMIGYHNREEENAEAFTEDGWFRTGDVGYLDDDGYLVITDRLKNIIVLSTGKNVSPQPIEDTYRQSPYIKEVIVIGDNQKYLTALIVPDFEALKSFAAQESIVYKDFQNLIKRQEVHHLVERELRRRGDDLAPHERVKKFVLLAEDFSQPGGPLTPTMKVRRDRLVQKYQNEIALMYLTGKNVSDIYL